MAASIEENFGVNVLRHLLFSRATTHVRPVSNSLYRVTMRTWMRRQ
jgi:hypothetical protein